MANKAKIMIHSHFWTSAQSRRVHLSPHLMETTSVVEHAWLIESLTGRMTDQLTG